MFGSKPKLKEGTHIFSIKKNGDFNDFIFAVVSGVDGRKVGVNGVIVNPIGLKNNCLLYTSPSPRDYAASRMPSSA